MVGKTAWSFGNDGLVAVNVQGSTFDDTIFVNVGVKLGDSGTVLPKTVLGCDLLFRAHRLFESFPNQESECVEAVQATVRGLEPALRALGSLAHLKERSECGMLSQGLVSVQARLLIEAYGSQDSSRTS